MTKPERSLSYTWDIYNEDDTGLTLVELTDSFSGAKLSMPLVSRNKRAGAHIAWGGARHSRAPGDTVEIMSEMGEEGVDPNEKAGITVHGYGHSSVADMARQIIHFNHVPMHLPFSFFNCSEVNSGQEKSTRYQGDFESAVFADLVHYLPYSTSADFSDLNQSMHGLAHKSLEIFNQHREVFTEAYTKFFNPKSAKQKSALSSRVLDSVRFSLLFGMNTGFAFETSMRDWARILSVMKTSQTPLYRGVAHQLETLLAPPDYVEDVLDFVSPAPSLIRHTEPNDILPSNLSTLEDYLERQDLPKVNTRLKGFLDQSVSLIEGYSLGQKMAAQYLMVLKPGTSVSDALDWAKNNLGDVAKRISHIIYNGHNQHKELPSQLAATTSLSFDIACGLGEGRDLNRHRAWTRCIPSFPLPGVPTSYDKAMQVLAQGFCLPLYLEVKDFKSERKAFENDIKGMYKDIKSVVRSVHDRFGDDIDYSFVFNLLPLAHRIPMVMHGNPKQANYFNILRERPGGHINYRVLAYDMSQAAADSDPYLEATRLPDKPDPASREQFFNRS